MKIKGMLLAVATIIWSCLDVSFAVPVPAPPTTQGLLKAPIIVYAYIGDISEGQVGQVPRSPGTPEKMSRVAVIHVRFWIKGNMTNEALTVRQILEPELLSLDRSLVKGKSAVLFLSDVRNGQNLKGINEYDFALQSEHVPHGRLRDLAKEEALRVIAEINIVSTNEVAATRWVQFLADLYEEQDKEFFLEQLSSKHMSVRGIAIATLCRHTSVTPSLYGQAIAFLKATAASNSLGAIRREIAESFGGDIGPIRLSNDQLREWIASEVPELRKVAVRSIRRTHNAAMLPEVINLMQKASNIDLQYSCISAISAIEGQPGPSYTTFMTNPSKYVREAVERHTSPK